MGGMKGLTLRARGLSDSLLGLIDPGMSGEPRSQLHTEPGQKGPA